MSSKRTGLNRDEQNLISDSYGTIAHYFERPKCLDISVDAEDENECKLALHFFENEQIKLLLPKLRKITLLIECGAFVEVDIWNKMENIIKLLNASKHLIHHLNLFLTHESGADDDFATNNNITNNTRNDSMETRRHLFKQFMQLIVDASRHKLNYVNFRIEGIERDLNDIYISYLVKLLLPNISNRRSTKSLHNKKKKNRCITGLQLTIFGRRMFRDFCDDRISKLPEAIMATQTLKSMVITFDNINMNHKFNNFLHSFSLNNSITSLWFSIHDKGNRRSNRRSSMLQLYGHGNDTQSQRVHDNDDTSIITSFYVTLYNIFRNKGKHLTSFTLEYTVSRRGTTFYDQYGNDILCKLDRPNLMSKYILQPIINHCEHLTQFEWKVDMRWNKANLYPLSMLLSSNKHDFESINVHKMSVMNVDLMSDYISSLKKSNRCKELKLSGLNGRLFTEPLCNFIATDCGSGFETLRFKMKYEMNDIGLLEKHTLFIMDCFVLRLAYLYKMYQIILPSILNEFGMEYNDFSETQGLPPCLIGIIVDFCKMRHFKLDLSLLMNRKMRQPLAHNNLEEIMSLKMNALINKLELNQNDKKEQDIVIKRDIKNNHPLLRQLFASFCYAKNLNFYFSAVDCKLLFSINP